MSVLDMDRINSGQFIQRDLFTNRMYWVDIKHHGRTC